MLKVRAPMLSDDWLEHASCVNAPTEVFFPEIPPGTDPARAFSRAARYCAVCRVRQQCLDYVLPFEESTGRRDGYWGGMTPKERDRYYWETRLQRPRNR